MFIVTMDLFLDVVAIRLDGGFWTWVGKPIELTITQSTFMSVIWVNFLGYMIETPAVVWLTLTKREKIQETNWKKQFIHMFLIAFGGIVITAIGSLIALLLNMVTNDWFACVAFLGIWLTVLGCMVRQVWKVKWCIPNWKCWNLPMLIFWAAMYGYCMLGMIALEIQAVHGWFFVFGIVCALVTELLCIAETNK